MGTRKRKDVYTINLSCNLETKFRGNKYLSIIISFLAFPLFLEEKKSSFLKLSGTTKILVEK